MTKPQLHRIEPPEDDNSGQEKAAKLDIKLDLQVRAAYPCTINVQVACIHLLHWVLQVDPSEYLRDAMNKIKQQVGQCNTFHENTTQQIKIHSLCVIS